MTDPSRRSEMSTKEFSGIPKKQVSEKSGRAKDESEGQALFEMANLRPERTGLPFVVFISQKGGAGHDVRVKVARATRVRPSEMITVAIRPTIRVVRGHLDALDLDLLTQWIDLNKNVLIDYWDGVIEYTEDAMNAIKSLGSAST
jgi:hypothetical protein